MAIVISAVAMFFVRLDRPDEDVCNCTLFHQGAKPNPSLDVIYQTETLQIHPIREAPPGKNLVFWTLLKTTIQPPSPPLGTLWYKCYSNGITAPLQTFISEKFRLFKRIASLRLANSGNARK